jgi:hypothetical protein
MEALRFIFSNFWIWLGFTMTFTSVVYATYKLIAFIYNRTLRHRVLMKYGYPPANCDADGDLNPDFDAHED